MSTIGSSGKARRPPYDPHLLDGGSVVPYVGQWTGEDSPPYSVVRRPEGGIGYADETIMDRDEWGVLWVRMRSRIGVGKPLFTKLHPRRQRRAMLRLICQVCAEPADRSEQGMLWLLPGSHVSGADEQDDGIATTQPPLCRQCARISSRMCPALRDSHVALRARSHVYGVTGVVFRPGHPFPRMTATDYDGVVPFSSPAIAWTLATHLVRVLTHVGTIEDQYLS
jgi:hypothetical protein